jgi:hypothetical protein
MNLLETAVEWYALGYTILPCRPDGSKAPAVDWKDFQTTRPTPEQTVMWASNHPGIGVLTGTAANLEMIEAEGRAIEDGHLELLTTLADDSGLLDLWTRILCGYSEVTPGGGIHWYYRVDGAARPNTKLASRPKPGGKDVLWETRGDRGFSIIAPSGGSTHPSGRSWEIVSGTPADIPLLTEAERDTLFALVSMLDESPSRDLSEHPSQPRPTDGSLRPGDDFNLRARWDDILTPHGWTAVARIGSGLAWRRPEKRDGISATTGQAADADRLYVFSTSTVFDSEVPYSKFGAYATLNHDGDHAAAARALRLAGWGTPLEAIEEIAAWERPTAAPQSTPLDPPPSHTDTEGGAPERPSTIDRLLASPALAAEVQKLLHRQDAQEIVAEIYGRRRPLPAVAEGTVADILANPIEERWRFHGIWPAEGRVLLVAQRKTGKTTMIGNIAKSLILGVPFLDHTAHAIGEDRTVVVLNYEVSAHQFARWMDDMGVPGDRMYVFNMRGTENPLLTEVGRWDLAQKIKAQRGEVLIVDPFGRAFPGEQNDASQVSPWLVNLDQVAEMGGCSELLLTAHAGWGSTNVRSRGSSALEDWPDAILTMRKDEDGNRFIKADGRDVDVEESMLRWHEDTRTYSRTTEVGMTADERGITRLADLIVEQVKLSPGLSMSATLRAIRENGGTWSKRHELDARRQAESRGQIRAEAGPKGAVLLYPVDLWRAVPNG